MFWGECAWKWHKYNESQMVKTFTYCLFWCFWMIFFVEMVILQGWIQAQVTPLMVGKSVFFWIANLGPFHTHRTPHEREIIFFASLAVGSKCFYFCFCLPLFWEILLNKWHFLKGNLVFSLLNHNMQYSYQSYQLVKTMLYTAFIKKYN